MRLRRVTKKTAQKNKERRVRLDIYYSYLIDNCRRCEESQAAIPFPSKMNICHILPKRTYKSVETNLDNYIYLTDQLHAKFDSIMDRMDLTALEKEFPNSWNIVCDRVKLILPYVKERKKLIVLFEEKFGSLVN